MQHLISWVVTSLSAAAMIYTIMASGSTILAERRTRRLVTDSGQPAVQPVPASMPPVTLLKPLCGAERDLHHCLRSFCEQHYPQFQIVFGVQDADDPAVAVVRRLQREYPHLDLHLAIDPARHGSSRKISNLINMMPFARHGYLVLSDSDVRVPPGYLAALVGPLMDPGVGIVTCAYRGRPAQGVWSRLGSMFIDDWFIPSVRVAALLGSRAFAFGATIGIRRDMLERIGGFAAIVDQLADDYRLGELTRQLGARTELSDVLVETAVNERSLRGVAEHELRWLRTIRTVRPAGYAFSFVTLGVPVALLAWLLSGGSAATVIMLAVTATARVMLRIAHRGLVPAVSELGLLLVGDCLLFTLWCWSFFGRRVRWGQGSYRVSRDGSFHPVP